MMGNVFELLLAAVLTMAPLSMDVVIRDRLTPTDLVESMAGTCGGHRYRIELEHHATGASLLISADDRPISSVETAKVVEAVTPGYFMYEPKFAECFWDRPSARFRLLTGGPKDGGNPIWLSFEISPDGKVSAIRRD
jgi:hypothetical protein